MASTYIKPVPADFHILYPDTKQDRSFSFWNESTQTFGEGPQSCQYVSIYTILITILFGKCL